MLPETGSGMHWGGMEKQEVNRKQGRGIGTIILPLLLDVFIVNLAYFAALWFRFDGSFALLTDPTNIDYLFAWAKFAPIYSAVCVAVFALFRLYRTLWHYASYPELVRVLLACVITGVLHVVGITLLFCRMPISYYCIGFVFQTALIVISRFAYRMIDFLKDVLTRDRNVGRVMLIGAGMAGQMILKDMHHSRTRHDRVFCIVDDDPKKWGMYLDGIPVVGDRNTILENVEKYRIEKIYLAIPSASAEARRDILNICKETDCELKNLPGIFQFVAGDVSVESMTNVSVEDLLGREPIRADLQEVFAFIHDKVVLVTGGGGSIGSELCRQIAEHHPKKLLIFDVYENNAYEIQNELGSRYPELDFETLIGSVRDSRRIYEVFETYHPEIVYHAAAHKHVPLMEDSPNEAIKNNVFGTYKTAYAAMVHGCERFVLISTDKAVNPTNIMGASKRLCEMIIQAFDAKIKAKKADEIPQLFTHEGIENADKDGTGRVFREARTEFVAVRFGNVLGSNGSVVPLFKQMIQNGGPVKVTHPDIIRYFMTIPEAVSLVLLAGTYAKGGEIFVLDMGSPVKIDTLARNLIRLSGLRPDVDIKIEYTGLRPGEKLYEEKLMAEEGLKKTENDLIHIGCPIPFDTDEFFRALRPLMDAAYANRTDIRDKVRKMVVTYRQAE